MTLAQFITLYGYPALFFGVLVEGETILVVAGLAAHRGYLSLPAVIGVAFVATILVDQALFTFGRRRGAAYVARHVTLRAKIERVNALLHRHHGWFIVIRRFLYGLRTVSSIVLGMSSVPLGRFVAFNAVGAAIWAAAIAGLGYLFGAAVVSLLGRIEHVEREIMIGILGAGALLWIVRAAWSARQRRRVRRALGTESSVDATNPHTNE
jgi:membrane protein DedA with SNARE-associated domain